MHCSQSALLAIAGTVTGGTAKVGDHGFGAENIYSAGFLVATLALVLIQKLGLLC